MSQKKIPVFWFLPFLHLSEFFHEPVSFTGFLGASWKFPGGYLIYTIAKPQEAREGNRFMKKITYLEIFCFSYILLYDNLEERLLQILLQFAVL